MKIKEIFIGNIIASGLVIQHEAQLIFSLFLSVLEWTTGINNYKEFNRIIYFLTIMHVVWFLLTNFADFIEKKGQSLLRKICHFFASIVYQVVIIMSLGMLFTAIQRINKNRGDLP
jgi:hypothetical protein